MWRVRNGVWENDGMVYGKMRNGIWGMRNGVWENEEWYMGNEEWCMGK